MKVYICIMMFPFVKCSWYCAFQLLYCHTTKPAWTATPFFSSNQEVPDMYYKSIIFQFSWRGKLKSIIYCCNCQKQCILVIKVTKNLERALPPPLLDKIQKNSRFFFGMCSLSGYKINDPPMIVASFYSQPSQDGFLEEEIWHTWSILLS